MSEPFLQFVSQYGQFNESTLEICRLIDPVTSPALLPYSSSRLQVIFGIYVSLVFIDDPLLVLRLNGYGHLIEQVKDLYRSYQFQQQRIVRTYVPKPREIYVYRATVNTHPNLEVYKIGVSKDVRKRSKAYRTAIPNFEILYCQPICDVFVEKLVHQALDPYRLDQHEFFNVALDVIIETIRQTNQFFMTFRQRPGDERHLVDQLTNKTTTIKVSPYFG